MKKALIFLLMCFLSVGLCQAQDNKKHQNKRSQEMWKELQDFKLKFLAKEMDLEDSQIPKFNELYNQMTEEKVKIFRETRDLEKKLKNNSSATDEDYAGVSKAITSAKEKDAEIEKAYDKKFSAFLSQKQIYKLKQAEEKFRQKMQHLRKNNDKKKDSKHHSTDVKKRNKNSKK